MSNEPSNDKAAPPTRGLRVRHEAGLLARVAFDAAQHLPRGRVGDLADQIRTAAISVYANLAEGEGRATTVDRLRCFTIAWGSLRELEALLDLAGYVGTDEAGDATRAGTHVRHVARLLAALRRALAAQDPSRPIARAVSTAPHRQRSTSSAPPTAPSHAPVRASPQHSEHP